MEVTIDSEEVKRWMSLQMSTRRSRSLDCHRRVVYESVVCSVEEQIGIVTHSSISSVIKEQ